MFLSAASSSGNHGVSFLGQSFYRKVSSSTVLKLQTASLINRIIRLFRTGRIKKTVVVKKGSLA